MDEVFNQLCEVFEDELERQENVLRLCLLQEQAVMRRDVVRLAAHTEALNLVLNETVAAEARRLQVAREAVEHLALASESQSFSSVIASAPDPWRSRLAEVQTRLSQVMTQAALTVKRNNRLIRRLLSNCNETIRRISGDVGIDNGYNPGAMRVAATARVPSLLNQAG